MTTAWLLRAGLACAALTAVPRASAGVIVLDATAGPTSLFADYFSEAFGRLNLDPDGFYAFPTGPGGGQNTTPEALRTFAPVQQFGSLTLFPNGPNFSLGTLTFADAGLTGVGAESAAVTALVLDTADDIGDPDLLYTTTTSGVSGTVSFVDGVVTAINLTAAVRFTTLPGGFPVPAGGEFDGTFAISGANFTLLVDDTAPSFPQFGLPDARIVWFADGTVNAVSAAPPVVPPTAAVPEPASALLLAGGAGVLGWAARRRRAFA